jgi:UDP-N-acetylmuramyl pentapeptide phosphotransferase/UDP-N-acetylglucosamine-1-phosphate transferase
MKLFIFLIILLLIYPINTLIYKSNFLPSQTGDKHQRFLGKFNIPLTGGLFILVFILFLFSHNLYFNYFLIIFFLLGVASDKNYIISPLIRFLFQMMFIITFVIFFDLKILDLRNEFFSELLKNNYFSSFFVIFCFLVLVNGSNFIDGLNGLQLGYYLIVIIILLKLNLLTSIGLNLNQSFLLILSLVYLLILNFKNKLFFR